MDEDEDLEEITEAQFYLGVYDSLNVVQRTYEARVNKITTGVDRVRILKASESYIITYFKDKEGDFHFKAVPRQPPGFYAKNG